MINRQQNIIGRFFAEEWQQALANTGAFYVQPATADMTLEQLNAIKATLSANVSYWLNQVISNTNSQAIANAQAIADLYQAKLDQVNYFISQKTPATNGGGSAETNNKSLMWILAIAAGAAILFFMNNKKQRQAA